MFPILKQIVSVAIFLFLAFLIGHALYRRYERPIREGLEGDLDITSLSTDVSGNPVVDESCDITDANKPIELAAAFEKVNKQTDMIRSLTESTEPAVPLKIDKNGNLEYLVINNLKLLMNNGIVKNEASLKAVYDQYIGNREITALTTELNSIKMDAASIPSASVSPSASTPSTSVSPASSTPSTSVSPAASVSPSASIPSATPLDPVAIHAKEIALMCRIKTVIDGHQTLLDRILEKKSDE
jgi:hypothetical protein